MISDEPDEDADTLDDENLMETFLDPAAEERDAAQQGIAAHDAAAAGDWPATRPRNVVLNIDGETLAWFMTNHADWDRAMGAVLQRWAAAQDQTPPQD